MIKILHAADLHLDSAFSSLKPEQAARRRKEQRLALQRLTDACQDCHIVLLAGDLFDSAHIYTDTLEALKEFFSSVKAQIFIAPGNHDYPAAGSPYLTESWGDNVHIFTSAQIEKVHLEELNCNVYGAAFTSMEMPALLQGFRVDDPSELNLMVLHGDLQSASVYNPISHEQIASSGLDYLALGHVHSMYVEKFGKTTCAFPGCMMARGFDECGEKGVLKVQVNKDCCLTEFLPLAPWKYEILEVQAGEDPLSSIAALLPRNTENDCWRIILKGEAESIDLAALEEALAPKFYNLSLRDRTTAKTQLWAGSGEDTLRGHFLQEIKDEYDRAEEGQKQTLLMAAKLVTALMDGREVVL